MGPPFTAMAKGNVAVSVGLMVILAGSCAIIAPLLLQFLVPIVAGDVQLRIDVIKMVGTLLGAQLLPLCLGGETPKTGWCTKRAAQFVVANCDSVCSVSSLDRNSAGRIGRDVVVVDRDRCLWVVGRRAR
jgi:hypothetical protein